MIRLAVVGATQLDALVAVSPRIVGAKFVAVVDASGEAIPATIAALGAKSVKSTVDELLESDGDGVDALVDLSPTTSLATIRAAIAADKHFLAAMPGSIGDETIGVASDAWDQRATQLRMMIASESRFLPSVQAVRSSLADGQLGEPGLVRIHRWMPPGSTNPLQNDIDLACSMVGHEVSVVHCLGNKDVADYRQLHLGFDGGAMALIDHAPLPDGAGYFTLSLIGSSGAAYADDHHNQQLRFGGGPPTAAPTGEGTLAQLAQFNEFVAAVREERDPAITVQDWVIAASIAGSAAESLRSGKPIHSNS